MLNSINVDLPDHVIVFFSSAYKKFGSYYMNLLASADDEVRDVVTLTCLQSYILDYSDIEEMHISVICVFQLYMFGSTFFSNHKCMIGLGYLAGLVDVDRFRIYNYGTVIIRYLYVVIDTYTL